MEMAWLGQTGSQTSQLMHSSRDHQRHGSAAFRSGARAPGPGCAHARRGDELRHLTTQGGDLAHEGAGGVEVLVSPGVRKTVSTSGIRLRFMPAIWNSYSKSPPVRRLRTTTRPSWLRTKSRSRPSKAWTSILPCGRTVRPPRAPSQAARRARRRCACGGLLPRPGPGDRTCRRRAHQVFVPQGDGIEGAG